jgi:hypothetical protein
MTLTTQGAKQSLDERERALASVLPLLHAHHDLISRVRTACVERVVPPGHIRRRAPETTIGGGEFAWVSLEERYREEYRLDAIADSLERLHRSGHPRAMLMLNAIYTTFIEPFDRYLSQEQRGKYAHAGLRYLATEIPGDIRAYRPPKTRDEKRADRDREIRRLIGLGLPAREIAQRLRCSTVTVQAVRQGRVVRHGSLERSALRT